MGGENPLISIIILNYNSGHYLTNCIDSILKTNFKNFEIIVIDNKSTDNSHIRCKEKYNEIILIENEKNYGFCEGNNIGIKNARGDYIVILNPDTEVTVSWLSELLDAFKKNGEGLYQPKIMKLDKKNEIQSSGNMIQLFGFGFTRDRDILDKNQHKEIEEIGYPSGACLFTSVNVLKKIGMFEPFLFLYHDDLELGWRASMMGIRSFLVPKSIIYHAESPNLKWSSSKFFWLERNRKYCILTHYSKESLKKMKLSLFLVDLMVWIFYISKGFVKAKINADAEIRKNRKIIEEKRNDLESRRKIDDGAIINKFSDKIEVPEGISYDISNKLMNFILVRLSKKIRKEIKQET